MIYIIFVIFLFVLSYKLSLERHNSNSNSIIYYFVLFGFFFITAFRYQVGCDWDGYNHMYHNATFVEFKETIAMRDNLFWAILIFMHEVGLPYPYINIFCSAIFFTGIHVLARRQSNPLSFLVLLFPILIINIGMASIRQGAAVGIICIAFTYFIDRRLLRFIIYVILATGFHGSAIVFILMSPFISGRYTFSQFFKGFIIAAFSLCIIFFTGLTESFDAAIRLYVDNKWNMESAGAIFRNGFLSLTAIFFFFFLKEKWRKTFPSDFNLICLGTLGMLIATALIPLSTVISDRMGYYFTPIQVMIFARLSYLPFKSHQLFYSQLPYLVTFFVFFIWAINSWHFQECYLPYDTWIFGLPEGNFFIDPKDVNIGSHLPNY